MTLHTLASARPPLGTLAQGAGAADDWVVPLDVPLIEAAALKVLALATDYKNWNTNTNWGLTTTANDWHGITVSGGVVRTINLNNNALNGSVATWQPGDFTSLIFLLNLSVNSNLAGLLSSWDTSTARDIRLNNTGVSGGIAAWGIGNMARLFLQATQLSGSPDMSLNTALFSFRYESCSLPEADVDAVLQEIFDNRFDFTTASPSLNIGGNNSAPSAAGLVLVGLLTAGAGFNPWIITFTAPP